MRARYTAYVLGRSDFVFRSWHPRTRPDDVSPSSGLSWTGLTVLGTEGGAADDDTGIVRFEARYSTADGPALLHETSRFERRRGAWVYVGAADDDS